MLYTIVLVLLVIVSICLVGIVLLQSGKGNNLTNAFEGEATFGNRSGDVLTKSTMVLAVSFIVLCLVATILYKHGSASIMQSSSRPASRAQENLRSMAQQEADEAAAKAAEAAQSAAESAEGAAAEATETATEAVSEAAETAEETK
ncbi:preprotein translocase subunit SecG [bacterium]|nr:preprotein translocase subunit SecG [bacterium]